MSSITTQAVAVICDRDPKYRTTDANGRANMRKRYALHIAEGLGQGDEIDMTPKQIADWYAKTFWR